MNLEGIDEEDLALLRHGISTLLNELPEPKRGDRSVQERELANKRARMYALLARMDVLLCGGSNSSGPT